MSEAEAITHPLVTNIIEYGVVLVEKKGC